MRADTTPAKFVLSLYLGFLWRCCCHFPSFSPSLQNTELEDLDPSKTVG